jgi:peptidoglycan/xylan/chitin deacetylase (PgdA/CDA1 family)
MEYFCKNHSDRKSRKKCQYCHEHICDDCQVLFMQRTFCSIRCLAKALLEAGFSLLKFSQKQAAGKRKVKLPPIHFASSRLIIDLFFAALIVAILFALGNLSKEIRLLRLSQQTGIAEKKSLALSSSNGSGFAITKGPDAMVLENHINIAGEAADNVILSLVINDQITAVTLPQKNRFVFENVHLNYGANEITVRGINATGETTILEKIITSFGGPRMEYLARDFSRGSMMRSNIALTFDGGAGNGTTSRILDNLAAKHIRCTMFLTGAFIDRYSDLVKRMVKDGHEIGNHTWSHPHLTTFETNRRHNTLPEITREKVQSELTRTADKFFKVTGKKMAPYWRAPYGEHNQQIRAWAAEAGFAHVGWTMGKGETMDTLDWVSDNSSSTYQSSAKILERILSFGQTTETAANGGIILMHLDTERNGDQPSDMLPALIDSLQYRGYQLVTISEMMNR